MLLFFFIYILVPRIAAIVDIANDEKAPTSTQEAREVEEFDPYAPIIIVPNDYQEGDEIVIIEE